jgi:hypothetical protein
MTMPDDKRLAHPSSSRGCRAQPSPGHERSVSQEIREERKDLKGLWTSSWIWISISASVVTPRGRMSSGRYQRKSLAVPDIAWGGADGFSETIKSVKKHGTLLLVHGVAIDQRN